MPGRTIAVVAAWLVLVGGAAGAWMLRRRRLALVVLAPLALAIVTTVLAFGYPRFRYAADVGLIVLAGCALARVRLRRPAPAVGA
jgi:hypothetical protein